MARHSKDETGATAYAGDSRRAREADDRTGHADVVTTGPGTRTGEARGEQEARDRFGGMNWGAVFFGWLVAVALAVLLSSVIGAVATALGASTNLTQDQAQRDAGTIGIAAAVAVVVVLSIAYFTGGYVSGRMSRFDGTRQGFGVWVLGLVVTLVAVGLGALFGTQYNVLDRVDLPRIPVPTDAAT
ncbi:MAG TPA: hypothetical protein VD864_16905, partial [Nocardioides sp.]|nr:hypothetical protein [Nocardioides sp.]